MSPMSRFDESFIVFPSTLRCTPPFFSLLLISDVFTRFLCYTKKSPEILVGPLDQTKNDLVFLGIGCTLHTKNRSNFCESGSRSSSKAVTSFLFT